MLFIGHLSSLAADKFDLVLKSDMHLKETLEPVANLLGQSVFVFHGYYIHGFMDTFIYNLSRRVEIMYLKFIIKLIWTFL